MKVDEIRSHLKDWPSEDLVKLCTAMYQKLPKEKKGDFDAIIAAGYPSPAPKAAKKKTGSKKSLEAWDAELDVFLEDARKGLYYFDNDKITPRERSGWRFPVARFIKAYTVDTDDLQEYDHCTWQLLRLYDVLSRCVGYCTFVSPTPFKTLGYDTQAGFYSMLCQRYLVGNQGNDLMSLLIKEGCNGKNDEENRDEEIHLILKSTLQQGKVGLPQVSKVTEELMGAVKKTLADNAAAGAKEWDYDLREQYESLNWFQVLLLLEVEGVEKAYDYLKKARLSQNREEDLYHLLMDYQMKGELWIRLYEYALKDHVHPRGELKEAYEKWRDSI